MASVSITSGAFLSGAFALCFGVSSFAQESFRVLPEDFNADKTQQMMRSYFRGQVHKALDKRLEELETALQTPAALVAYQQKKRDYWIGVHDQLPERTDLKPRITGTIVEDGFTIEKVIFESRPGFPVTANVYRPAGPGPFPAILHPVGHSENGKAYESYQKANRLLARYGFLVLCFDPIGQGERKQILGPDRLPLVKGSNEHQQLGVAPILLGEGLGGYMLWDGVRALDYLGTRPDVDNGRIGCTGNSGGGNMTSYLMAFDDRIIAAAPGCFMTTHRRKNENPGPGDAEQNPYGQIRAGFDHPDYAIVRAPKPTLILAATKDFVPIDGTWEAYRQAKRAYTSLGYPERVDLVEVNEKHGFSKGLREAAVRFFARWLQGREIAVFENEEIPVLSDEELFATPDGQVLHLEGARSLFDLFVERGKDLAAKRGAVTKEIIREVTGIRPLEELPEMEADRAGGDVPEKWILKPEPGIVLPALHWPEGTKESVLIVPAEGMNAVADEAERLNEEGHPVLVVEIRDTGETATNIWRFFGADYYVAHMLGKCWLGMQSEDILSSARWLAARHQADTISLRAIGELAPSALHAAALEPGIISKIELQEGLSSWDELLSSREAYPQIHNAVYGALRYYDLPGLESLLRN